MAWMHLSDFAQAIPLDHYRQSHPWFSWSGVADIVGAWRLYKGAQNPALGFLLLGDTKIRMDPTLVQAFGLMSAAGVQDPEMVQMVAALKIQGAWRGTGGPETHHGSILSDQNWSPLLNDSLILGGVHRQTDFHFVDARTAALNFEQPPGVAGVRLAQEARSWAAQRRLADLSDRPWALQVWRQFFQQHQSVLWDSTRHVPRVLARELIGLKTFGYQAQPGAFQLSFAATRPAGHADFGTYLAALRSSGYFSPAGQPALLASLSHFLFGHADALLPA